jgi:hypothetical protein
MQAALKRDQKTSFVGGLRMKAETSLNSTTNPHSGQADDVVLVRCNLLELLADPLEQLVVGLHA